MDPLQLIFGYVVCYVMTSSCTQKIAQSYEVNLFINIVFHFYRICINDFCS
jgi:hypothetical protein